MLNALESLHNLGYVHGDIKPDNILSDSNRNENLINHGNVTLIDFGQSRLYRDENNKHLPNKVVKFNNNEWFASLHLFSGNITSRRDDIISLGYTLIYFLNRFQEILEHSPTEKHIAEFKQRATPEEFCEGAECLIPYLKEAYSYDYETEPSYGKLRFILKNILLEKNLSPLNNFLWGNF